jgi:tRNA-2-methylthio-N6-dimethylallyladenosine synthase
MKSKNLHYPTYPLLDSVGAWTARLLNSLTMAPDKLLYIRTFGCQMNVHDSRRMEHVLRPLGYGLASSPEEADLILVNTCTVREKSRTKALSAVGRYARLKASRPGLLLGIAGCVAQQEGQALLREAPALDLVLGPDFISELPTLVPRLGQQAEVRVGFSEVDSYRFLQGPAEPALRGPTALVTIQKGCDNHCAYCIVPSVRGPEVSRPASEILDEVRVLVRSGVREVTLIGQNVNSYRGLGGGEGDFVALLEQVDRIEGLLRLRFTTSHPKDFGEDLARCFGRLRTLCPWLHLPVQSGATGVLQRMNRGYSREHYLGLVKQIRRRCPQVSLGTDLIVGFPGETDEEFSQTLSLVEQVQYDYAYSFKYSVRAGTPAAELADDVPEQQKARRLAALQALQDAVTARKLAAHERRKLPVLVEGPSRRGGVQLAGRAPGNQVVNFDPGDTPCRPGDLAEVLITAAGKHSLRGRLAGPAAPPQEPA